MAFQFPKLWASGKAVSLSRRRSRVRFPPASPKFEDVGKLVKPPGFHPGHAPVRARSSSPSQVSGSVVQRIQNAAFLRLMSPVRVWPEPPKLCSRGVNWISPHATNVLPERGCRFESYREYQDPRLYLSWMRGPVSETESRRFDPGQAFQSSSCPSNSVRSECLSYKEEAGGSNPSSGTNVMPLLGNSG